MPNWPGLVAVRYCRERATGADTPTAVAATMATAGRTVALSGSTVAVALAGLLVFSEPIMRNRKRGNTPVPRVASKTVVSADANSDRL